MRGGSCQKRVAYLHLAAPSFMHLLAKTQTTPQPLNPSAMSSEPKPRSCSPSTQEGLLRVVPATFPGKQEHLTVWDLSSMRFLLQHRWAAITSQVPPSAEDRRENNGSLALASLTTNKQGSRERGEARRRENLQRGGALTVSAGNKLALQASPLSQLIVPHAATAVRTRCQSAAD